MKKNFNNFLVKSSLIKPFKKILINFFYIPFLYLILKRQLKFKKKQKTNLSFNSNKKILFVLQETSHYQIFHLLILAKALEIRGAIIQVLICDEVQPACEIRNYLNAKDNDPCWQCRKNRKSLLHLFGLKVINLSSLITDDDLRIYKLEAKEIAQSKKYAAVILESPFTSMVNMGKKYYPFFPVSFLLKDKFESNKKINKISVPILIMHGKVDKIVPYAMGKKMYELANQPKFFYSQEYGDHMVEYDEKLLLALRQFIKSLN